MKLIGVAFRPAEMRMKVVTRELRKVGQFFVATLVCKVGNTREGRVLVSQKFKLRDFAGAVHAVVFGLQEEALIPAADQRKEHACRAARPKARPLLSIPSQVKCERNLTS